MSQVRDERLSTGVRLANVGIVITFVLGLASAIITSRLFGTVLLGQFTLVFTPVILVIQFSTVSEQLGLIQELTRHRPRSREGSGVFLVTFALSNVLTVIAAGLVLLAARIYFNHTDHGDLFAPAVVMVLSYVFIDNLAWNLDSLFSAHRAVEIQFVARVAQTTAVLVITPLMALVGRSVWELVFATIAASGVGLVVRLARVSRYTLLLPGQADIAYGRSKLGGIVRFGLSALPATASLVIASQSTVWILGAVATTATVGAWGRAMNLAGKLNEVPFRVAQVYYPSQLRHAEADDHAAILATLGETLRLSFVPLVALATTSAGAAAGVMAVFGKGFGEASGAMSILLIAALVFFLDVLIGTTLTAMGHPGVVSVASVGAMVVTLALVWPLSDSHGATGAALAVGIGQLVSLLWKSHALHRRLKVHVPLVDHARPVAAVLCAALVAFTVAHIIGSWSTAVPITMLAGTAGLGSFFAMVAGFGAPRLVFLERIVGKLGHVVGRNER
jgi:O-antigen/teichoic acid export membrane protein